MRPSHWSYRLALATTAAGAALEIGAIILFWFSLPPAVPIWFSRPWGADQLAHPAWLLVFPAGSVVVFMMNAWISSVMLSEHPMFARVLLSASFVVSILSLLAIVNILFLVV